MTTSTTAAIPVNGLLSASLASLPSWTRALLSAASIIIGLLVAYGSLHAGRWGSHLGRSSAANSAGRGMPGGWNEKSGKNTAGYGTGWLQGGVAGLIFGGMALCEFTYPSEDRHSEVILIDYPVLV